MRTRVSSGRILRTGGLLAALVLAAACGRGPGYPNEPTTGVGGLAWRSPPGEEMIEYSGQPGALDGRVAKFEGMDGYDKSLRSWYTGHRQTVFGLPDVIVTYIYDGGGLCGAVIDLDDIGRDEIVGHFGEPHRSGGGPYPGLFWTGKTADVELRGDRLLLIHHRATIAALGE